MRKISFKNFSLCGKFFRNKMAPPAEESKIEEPSTDLTDVAITKYKAAAEIAKGALAAVVEACVVGAKIIDLNKIGDEFMIEAAAKLYTKGKGKLEVKDKGIAFPTCVAVKDALCHIHPLPRYALARLMTSDPEADVALGAGDLVRITLSAHIDGYIAQTGHTLSVGAVAGTPATGRKADVMIAAHTAIEVALRTIKDGNTTSDLYAAVKTVLKVGILSYSI
jgi:methionine aminopeptidase